MYQPSCPKSSDNSKSKRPEKSDSYYICDFFNDSEKNVRHKSKIPCDERIVTRLVSKANPQEFNQ